MSDALVIEQIALFFKHTSFLCECIKSIKAWKTIDLGFVNHEHDIPELVKFFESKEEKLLIHKSVIDQTHK